MHTFYSKITAIFKEVKNAIYFITLIYGGNIWNGMLKHHVIPGWEDNLNGHKNRRFWALYQSMEHRPPIIVSSSFKLLFPKWINIKLNNIDIDFEKRDKMVPLFESMLIYENQLLILKKILTQLNIAFLIGSIFLACMFKLSNLSTSSIELDSILFFIFFIAMIYLAFTFAAYPTLRPCIVAMDEDASNWRENCIEYFRNSYSNKRSEEIHCKITERQIRKLQKTCRVQQKTKTTSL